MGKLLLMFPTPHTVQRIRRTQSGETALGQPIWTETTATLKVHGLQPFTMVNSGIERYDSSHAGRATNLVTLLTPDGDYQVNDQVIFRGVTYEVDGYPMDYTSGPFNFPGSGYMVNLRAVSDV